VRLYSRRGHDWDKRLAAPAESLRAIPTGSAILDAELCLLGADGAEADALLSALVLRADALEGCIEGSEEGRARRHHRRNRGLRSGALARGQKAGRERVDTSPLRRFHLIVGG